MMIGVNDLTDLKCNNAEILKDLTVLLSPYAPHLAEELWARLAQKTSITEAEWPAFDEAHLVESNFSYPVSFNGKMRFKIDLPLDFNPKQVEEAVLAHEKSDGYLGGNPPKKVIVVPGRIVNIVI